MNLSARWNKVQVATAVAVFFHLVGLGGILFGNREFFASVSSLNLLLMLALMIYSQEDRSGSFYLFAFVCFVTGMVVEVIGTSTGWLFGEYAYGKTLGFSVWNVPLIIGVNWFLVMYGCGSAIQHLMQKMAARLPADRQPSNKLLQTLAVVVDGATLAVLFDWVMEPVAISLGYWHWKGSGEIPLYNYVCWFLVSAFLLYVYRRLHFGKTNKFAIHLLLIQLMFFLILRSFL